MKNKLDTILRLALIVLSVIGAIDALYLLVLKFTQSEAMCIGNHGCITVNNSPYSVIFGVPVSLLGFLAYMMIGLILLIEQKLRFISQYSPLVVFGLSLTGLAFSAYLTYIEYFVIYAVCPFCIISAIVILLIFILSTVRLVRQPYQ